MKINVDKKALLTVASGVFGIGSVVVGLLSKNNEKDEIAEKAAEIAMKKMSENK